MDRPEAPQGPRIDLDLDPTTPPAPARRQRFTAESMGVELPKLEPVLKETDVGKDEAEATLGFLILASAFPGLVAMLLTGRTSGMTYMVYTIALGVGVLRRVELTQKWILWGALFNLAMVPAWAFVMPHAAMMLPSFILRNGALVALLCGKSLSRTAYLATLGALGIGILLGILGIWVG